LLRAFNDHDVRYLVVGAYALGVHGRPRATADLGVWIDATPENAPRVMRAVAAFGAPLGAVSEADFAVPGIVFQMGLPPVRDAFIRNTRATGRARDLGDIESLG